MPRMELSLPVFQSPASKAERTMGPSNHPSQQNGAERTRPKRSSRWLTRSSPVGPRTAAFPSLTHGVAPVAHSPPFDRSLAPEVSVKLPAPTLVVILAIFSSSAHAGRAPADGPPVRPAHTLLAAGDTAVVPLDLHMGQPVVEVMLNGKGPYRMFLDTGAGTTVLDSSLAAELGLKHVGKTRIGDPADPQAIAADEVKLDTLRIGSARFTGVPAVTWDRSALRPGPDRPVGVVGLPIFHELIESIDFPAATLRLTRGQMPAADGREIVAYETPDGVPLVPIDVAGQSMKAHLDTGSPGLLSIPEKDSARVHFAGPLHVVARGRTVNSEVTFRGAPLDGTFRIGGASFDHPLVVLNDVLPNANVGSRALRDCVLTLDAAHQRLRIERTRESAPDSTRHVMMH